MNVSGIRGSVPAVRPSAEKRSGVPDVEVCPFVTCAAETGVSHCGKCEEFPCELYELTLSEDAGEEERRAFAMARYRNFGLLDAQRFLEKQSD